MRCRPSLLRVLVAVPVLGLTGWLAAGVWQSWLGQRVRDHVARQQERAETDRRAARHRAAGGVVGAFATGRIRAGDSFAEVAARFPPSFTHPYQRCTRAVYDDPRPTGKETWVEVLVLDGRLLSAEWYHNVSLSQHLRGERSVRDVFFDAATPADRAVYAAEHRAYFAARRDAIMAAAGPLGYTGYYDPPR